MPLPPIHWTAVLFTLIACLIDSGAAGRAVRAQDATPASDSAPMPEPADESSATASLFPDPALESAIRSNVLSKRDNREPLSIEDVRSISRLVAVGRGIESLAGLQHCESLRLLELDNNNISDLGPLAGLKRLQSLRLAGNSIENISPLQNLTAMQLLDVSRNQIANLDALSKMTNLRSLYVADNQLVSIAPLASLTKLGALDLAGNPIEDLAPVAGLTWLTTLEISDTSVRSLAPLTALSDLSMLIMPNAPLESLQPLVDHCVQDANSDRRWAPYLRLYLNMQSDLNMPNEQVTQWNEALQTLRNSGVSIHDYRRATTRPTTP